MTNKDKTVKIIECSEIYCLFLSFGLEFNIFSTLIMESEQNGAKQGLKRKCDALTVV